MYKNFLSFVRSTLFLLPLVPYSLLLYLFYTQQISILTSGHEPFAYRFLFSVRFLNNDIGVWFPQGHLTTLFHNLVIYLNGWNVLNIEKMAEIIRFFPIYHHIVPLVALITILFFSYKKFSLLNHYLIVFFFLNSIIGFRDLAPHYFFITDYLTLNVILHIAALFIFIIGIKIKKEKININTIIYLSFFVVITLSNKITMLPVGMFAILPFILKKYDNFKSIKKVLGEKKNIFKFVIYPLFLFLFIIVASFNFNFSNINYTFFSIIKFILRPGQTDEDFIYLKNTFNYGYIYTYIYFSFIYLLFFYNLITRKIDSSHKALFCKLIFFISIIALLLCYFIYKRQAAMTDYESTLGLLMLAIGMHIMLLDSCKNKMYLKILTLYLFLPLITGAEQFESSINHMKKISKTHNIEFENFYKIKDLTKDNTVFYVHYDNKRTTASIDMFFLKGLSIPPTWNHYENTLNKFINSCGKCRFISSYNFDSVSGYEFNKLKSGDFIVSYIPKSDDDFVAFNELEKKFIKTKSFALIDTIDVSESFFVKKIEIKQVK